MSITTATCSNALRMPVGDLNEAVVNAIEEHALTPEAIEQVIQLSERNDVADLQAKLDREWKDFEKRIAWLALRQDSGPDAALGAR